MTTKTHTMPYTLDYNRLSIHRINGVDQIVDTTSRSIGVRSQAEAYAQLLAWNRAGAYASTFNPVQYWRYEAVAVYRNQFGSSTWKP